MSILSKDFKPIKMPDEQIADYYETTYKDFTVMAKYKDCNSIALTAWLLFNRLFCHITAQEKEIEELKSKKRSKP